MANLLIAAEASQHGAAYYMLTGTSDFEYVLDIMIEAEMITTDEKETYQTTLDGYRLSYKMAGMTSTLDAGDTEAICLYSATAGGALCGGIIHDTDSGLAEAWGTWISAGAFSIAASSEVVLTGDVD